MPQGCRLAEKNEQVPHWTGRCLTVRGCCPDGRAAYAISPCTTSYTSRRPPKLLVHHPRRLPTQDVHPQRIFPSFIHEPLQ